jgi:hypothetical protein
VAVEQSAHIIIIQYSVWRQVQSLLQNDSSTVTSNSPYQYRKVSLFHKPRRPLGRIEVYLYSIFDLGSRRGW